MLNAANVTLTVAKMLPTCDACCNEGACTKAVVSRLNRRAVHKLLNGPANAMTSSSVRLPNAFGLYWTGLPQPKPAIKKANEPTGSKWASGLNVSRPCDSGNGSPRRVAAHAWANSCTVIATTTAQRKVIAERGLLRREVSIVLKLTLTRPTDMV